MVEKAKEIVWPGIRGDIGEEYFDRVMKVLQ